MGKEGGQREGGEQGTEIGEKRGGGGMFWLLGKLSSGLENLWIFPSLDDDVRNIRKKKTPLSL